MWRRIYVFSCLPIPFWDDHSLRMCGCWYIVFLGIVWRRMKMFRIEKEGFNLWLKGPLFIWGLDLATEKYRARELLDGQVKGHNLRCSVDDDDSWKNSFPSLFGIRITNEGVYNNWKSVVFNTFATELSVLSIIINQLLGNFTKGELQNMSQEYNKRIIITWKTLNLLAYASIRKRVAIKLVFVLLLLLFPHFDPPFP